MRGRARAGWPRSGTFTPIGASAWLAATLATTCLIAPAWSRTPADPPIAVPPPSAQSRLASPVTTAVVQQDSVFAPVVAATPALRTVVLGGISPYGEAPSDSAHLSLDGDWRFRLESTECNDDESRCEGIAGRWFAPELDDSSWRTLSVPGHFTRQIPLDELGGRESRTPFNFAWYRRELTLPDAIDPATQHLRLVFGAVDYLADVWFDGVQLDTAGAHLGTFNPFAFDLPPLATRGPHTIAVRVQKPIDPGILACGDGSGGLTDLKVNLDGTKGYHDSRPGGNDDNFDALAKQSLHTGGIVQPVELVATGPIRIDWLFVTALPAAAGSARVLLSYTLTNLTDGDLLATVTTGFTGPGLGPSGAPGAGMGAQGLTAWVALHPGPNRVELTHELTGISYWFPAGHAELGGPAVYAAETTVVEGWRRGGDVAASDVRTDHFGIRSLGLITDRCEDRFAGSPPDPTCADRFAYITPPPEEGETPGEPLYQRFINDQRIFVSGAGAIPNSWVAFIDRDAADQFMSLLRRINGNHVNVHGQIAPPVFYDAADTSGITVVQDFELQWAYNDSGQIYACNDKGSPSPAGSDPALADRLVETAAMLAADMVYSLYNHPSIVHWVMHNEPPWELAQEIGGDSPAGERLDRRMVEVATSIDQTRPVKAGSGVGDSHEYRGYASCSYFDVIGLPGRDLCHNFYREPPTYPTEFGSSVWPFSAKRWMPPDLLFPSDRGVRRQVWTDTNPKNGGELVPWLKEWVYHASHPEQFSTYVGSPADYDSFQDYALASQLYQAAYLKFYIEHFRKDRFRPTAGLRLFYLREYWESAFFGLFDEYDLPSAAVGPVANAYAPLLVTTETVKPTFAPGETVHLPIWIVNDLHAPVPDATLRWTIERVAQSYVLRGAEDSTSPPYQDLRRSGLGLAELLPPHPTITTIEMPGAAVVGSPLVSGSRRVTVLGDSVSAREGAVAIDFVAPQGPERIQSYVLSMTLESSGRVVAANSHLISVTDPTFDPPPGLSDGTTAFGEDSGDLPLRFALRITGLAPGVSVEIATPGFAGTLAVVASGTADASGGLVLGDLAPDEYLVTSEAATLAHLSLTQDSTLELGR